MIIKVDFSELLTRGFLDIDPDRLTYDYGRFVVLDNRMDNEYNVYEHDIRLHDYFEDPFNPTETEKALLKLQKGIEIIYD